MKILVFAFVCDPSKGSEPNYGYNLAAGLEESGHEVWVITQSGGRKAIEAELARSPRPNLHFVYLDQSPRWHKAYQNQLGMYAFYINWEYKAGKLGRKLDKEHDFDLCHHITWGSFQMGTGASLVGKPFVYGPCGGGQFAFPKFKEYFLNGWRTEVVRKYVSQLLTTFNPLLKRTLGSKLGYVVATNKETYDLAQSLGAKRLTLFSDPGLPVTAWKESVPPRVPKSDKLNLIWTGRLAPRKGLKFTLKALSYVDKSVPVHLTIVGDGQQGKDVPGWIAEFGLQDRVTWMGAIPWAQVQEEYGKADGFIFTTLRDSVPMQYLEAMAVGLPIITLNMHGATGFVPDAAGYKIPVDTDPDDIAHKVAAAIEDFYRRPEKWQGMQDAGRALAYKYLWPQKIVFYNDLYKKLLAEVGKSVKALA